MEREEIDIQMNSKLILYIEEHDSEKDVHSIDTKLFIGYSNQDEKFFIRGKRQDIRLKKFVPYAFYCRNIKSLYNALHQTYCFYCWKR